MGVKNYLIEGVSGAGKTTVAEELQQSGYHVIHADRELAYVGDPETGEPLERLAHGCTVDAAAYMHKHWIWPEDKIRSLIADQSNAISFFCGASRNFHKFIELFDEVFVLELDIDTLKRRLAGRSKDEFGGKPIERELIFQLHETKEDVPKNALRIDATAPLHAIVDDILSKCRDVDIRGRRWNSTDS
jgi:adenylate kinase family enzyme